jgi:hypothetical protein
MGTSQIIESQQVGGEIECVVKVLDGSVSVGDRLVLRGAEDRTSVGWFEVLEIRYFQREVASLESNFGGQLLLIAHGDPGEPEAGAELVPPSG